MKTWWQVNVYPKVFGFSTSNTGRIINHPDWKWQGIHVSQYKKWLIENKALVFKIADQLC